MQRHRARVHAVAATRRVDAVFSHTSAAVIHGLPLLQPPGPVVHAITDPTVRRRSSGISWHRRAIDESDIVELDGVRLTSLEATLVDLLRTECFAAAVVSLDAVVSDTGWRPRWDSGCPRVPRDVLEKRLDDAIGGAGTARGRAALGFADGRAESVGESLSRVQMHAWGLPRPELQASVLCPSGGTRRVDFFWPGYGLVGEFDGRVKYSRHAGNDDAVDPEVVWREKRREDDIRATGLSVARWLWSDALDGISLLATLGRHGLSTDRSTPRPVFSKGTR